MRISLYSGLAVAIIAGDSAKAREDGLGGGLATTDELSQTNNSIDVVNTAETDSASELWSEIDSEGFSESEGESESDSDAESEAGDMALASIDETNLVQTDAEADTEFIFGWIKRIRAARRRRHLLLLRRRRAAKARRQALLRRRAI